MSRLTRAEMTDCIKRGEGVLVDGRIITNESELPGEAENAVASGDIVQIELTEEQLEAKKAEIDAELAKLAAAKKADAKEAKKAEAEAKKAEKDAESKKNGETPPAQETDYEKMPFAELKALAESKGLTVPVGTSKTKLIEMLSG